MADPFKGKKLSEIDWEQDVLSFEEDTTTVHDSVYVSFMGPFSSPRIVDIDSDRRPWSSAHAST